MTHDQTSFSMLINDQGESASVTKNGHGDLGGAQPLNDCNRTLFRVSVATLVTSPHQFRESCSRCQGVPVCVFVRVSALYSQTYRQVNPAQEELETQKKCEH